MISPILLQRLQHPGCPEELVRSAASQVARDDKIPLEESLPLLCGACLRDTRPQVACAAGEGIIEVLRRATHADTVRLVLPRALQPRNVRVFSLLLVILADREIADGIRQIALELLDRFENDDLDEMLIVEAEATLARCNADRELPAALRREIAERFGPDRATRPRLALVPLANRDDETVVTN